MEVSTEGKQCLIHTIPNEVLHLIIEKASEPVSPKNHPNYVALPPYGDLFSLALVCHKVNTIATKSLYSCICLYIDEYREENDNGGSDGDGDVHRNKGLSTHTQCVRLYQALRDKPELRRYCTRFILDNRGNLLQGDHEESLSLPSPLLGRFSTPMTETFVSIVVNCIEWLPNTRILIISGLTHGTFLQGLGDLERIDILKDIFSHHDSLELWKIQVGLNTDHSYLKHLIMGIDIRA